MRLRAFILVLGRRPRWGIHEYVAKVIISEVDQFSLVLSLSVPPNYLAIIFRDAFIESAFSKTL
jgi:hypothetical protein